MAKHIHEVDMTAMMHSAIRTQLNDPTPDAVLNIESHCYDLTLTAESCDYDIDIGKNVWLNKGRWSRLIREYVPREPMERFVAQGQEILSGDARQGATANMMFRDPDRYAKKHRWGGCIMGATFRGDGKRDHPTLTIFSRTTYIGYMGLLDAGIGHVLARMISGGDASRIHFRWVISSSQLHCFKTLPFIYSQPDLMKRLEGYAARVATSKNMPPTWYHMAKWYAKVLEHFNKWGVEMLEHEKYGPFRRIKRRWLESQGHLTKAVPPSLKMDELDFSKAEGSEYDPSKEHGFDGDDE